MNHGLASGRYRVPLIGGAAPEGIIARTLDLAQAKLFRRQSEAAKRKLYTETARQLREQSRPVGKPAGTWMDDLTAIRQCVLLCWRCVPKFESGEPPYYKTRGYHKDTRYSQDYGGVQGTCDDCRDPFEYRVQLYIHESYVGVRAEPGVTHIAR